MFGIKIILSKNSKSFRSKAKIKRSKLDNDITKDVGIIFRLRYFEMLLINNETNLMLKCSANCVIVTSAAATGAPLLITDAKLYVWVIRLSSQYNAKLFQSIVKSINMKRHIYH